MAIELCNLAQILPGEFKVLVATVEDEPEEKPKGRGAYPPGDATRSFLGQPS
jgi:hypothetical protein